MPLHLGLALVLFAGALQGTFVFPMTLTKGWRWEHTWAAFSLLGMFLFNWLLTLLTIPQIFAIYRSVPISQILALILFGIGWGAGAVLFGIAMDRLGMALGYPIIMGLIASLGALIPMAVLFPSAIASAEGGTIIAGTLITVVGIVLCSYAASAKAASRTNPEVNAGSPLRTGLLIAILAGVLSCLPNVGMALAGPVISASEALGVPHRSSANAVWALFFTVGFLANFSYCSYRLAVGRRWSEYFSGRFAANLGLSAAMAVMWIGSFYCYGVAASGLGKWGVVAGWPLFISSSIVIGNLWGLGRGEWRGTSRNSRSLLASGLVVLLLAIATIAWGNTL